MLRFIEKIIFRIAVSLCIGAAVVIMNQEITDFGTQIGEWIGQMLMR